VTSHGHVLIIPRGRKVSIYDSDVNLVSTVPLSSVVNYLYHVVETSSGTFIICYIGENDRLYHISEVSMNGDVIRSYVAPRGEEGYQDIDTRHLVIDDVDNIYVVDHYNNRVLILNPTFRLNRILQCTAAGLTGILCRLCYSKDTRQLIVGLMSGQLDVWNISNK